jgi:hypothetical protein
VLWLNAFHCVPTEKSKLKHSNSLDGAGPTFQEFLPALAITAAPSSAADTPPAGTRLRDSVRRATVPTMKKVVSNVRRTATSVRVRKPRDREKERNGLQVPLKLTRSASTSEATFVFVERDETY